MTQSPIRVRASSWGALFDCSYRWEGENLLGIRKPSGPPAILGTAIHAGTAAFDKARLARAPISADEACGVLVDTLQHPRGEDEYDWRADEDLTQATAEQIGLTLLNRYCNEWSPRFEFLAVEMETKPLEIDCGNGIKVLLTGTLDRSRAVVHGPGGKSIWDLKTGSQAVQSGMAKTKGYRAQLGTYELLDAHTTGIAADKPAGILGMKTKGKPEIATGTIHNARELLVGDGKTPGLIEHAAVMFRTGLFPPNPNSNLCGERYCARWSVCPYHE